MNREPYRLNIYASQTAVGVRVIVETDEGDQIAVGMTSNSKTREAIVDLVVADLRRKLFAVMEAAKVNS